MNDIVEKPAAEKARTAGGDGGREFVMFQVGSEAFAVPLDLVKEIIRVPPMNRLPLAPPSFEGIANLRGGVLPVLNLRRVFGLEDVPHDDATRVVVLDLGRAVGIVVDRMSAVRAVDEDSIESAERIHASVDSDLLTGVIKGVAGKDGAAQLVMILDIARVVERESVHQSAAATAQAAEASGALDRAAADSTMRADETKQLVSFEVDGQEYALPIEDVQEIVHMPSGIARLPNAPCAVLGMVTMRNRLLPIISLRELFGLPFKEVSDDDRVVVVSPSASGHRVTVGVVTDTVREVLRVSDRLVDPLPAILSQDQALDDIVAVCRLEDGKRLVSILSAERMFDRSAVKRALEDAETASGEEDTVKDQDCRGSTLVDEEQLVIFKLAEEEYGVAIDAVQEIVRVPDKLTRIPRTPAFIEGAINLRGTVVPLVNQRRRFGLEEIERNDRQRIVVFTIRGVRTGFIVDSVTEVRRVPRDVIGPAPELSEAQCTLIRRVANLEKERRMILLLEADHLLGGDEAKQLRKMA